MTCGEAQYLPCPKHARPIAKVVNDGAGATYQATLRAPTEAHRRYAAILRGMGSKRPRHGLTLPDDEVKIQLHDDPHLERRWADGLPAWCPDCAAERKGNGDRLFRLRDVQRIAAAHRLNGVVP